MKAITSDFDIKSAHLQKLSVLKTALMEDLLTGRKRFTGLLNETEATA